MNAVGIDDADVVVTGGGPAGSTLATLAAMRGHKVILLEKQKFPRWQIGESLLPSTVHGVCRLTGVADELHKAGFTQTRGGHQPRAVDVRVLGVAEDDRGDVIRLSGGAKQVRPDPARPRTAQRCRRPRGTRLYRHDLG